MVLHMNPFIVRVHVNKMFTDTLFISVILNNNNGIILVRLYSISCLIINDMILKLLLGINYETCENLIISFYLYGNRNGSFHCIA